MRAHLATFCSFHAEGAEVAEGTLKLQARPQACSRCKMKRFRGNFLSHISLKVCNELHSGTGSYAKFPAIISKCFGRSIALIALSEVQDFDMGSLTPAREGSRNAGLTVIY